MKIFCYFDDKLNPLKAHFIRAGNEVGNKNHKKNTFFAVTFTEHPMTIQNKNGNIYGAGKETISHLL